jgi:hypothetical protein
MEQPNVSLVDYEELEERAAAMVVAELRAVGAQKRDVPGAPSRTRDYDVVFADGHEEPLEVTSNLDTSVMNALRRTDGGLLELDADVQLLWVVVGSHTWTDQSGERKPFDRKRVAALLVPLIEQLEREGEDSFDVVGLAWPTVSGAPQHHRRVALALHALGIVQGGAIPPTHPDARSGISVHLSGGGAWGPATITRTLEQIAALRDNVAKLEARRDAVRRHLFVVLSGRGATDMAGWALQSFLDGWVWDDEPPLPKLPEAITTIWAGNRTGGIYSTPPGSWRRFGEAATR